MSGPGRGDKDETLPTREAETPGSGAEPRPPRLTPPPRVETVRPVIPPGLGGAGLGARERGRGLRALILPGLVALLLLAAVAVALVLPRLVRTEGAAGIETTPPLDEVEEEASGETSLPARARDAGEDSDPAPKGLAEQALSRALELRRSLESRRVDDWGGEEYATAKETLARADELLKTGDHAGAAGAYGEAVQILGVLEARAPDVFLGTLEEGRAALAAGESRRAREAFGLAAALAPQNEVARSGLRRAEVLDQVLALVSEGERAERSGRLSEAEERYLRAVSLDPLSPRAQTSLARARAALSDDAFARSMSEGLEALGAGDYAAAESALRRADSLRPGSTQVADALQQLDQERTLQAIVEHRARALEHESREDWRSALAQYRAILEKDASVRFAQEGEARCAARAEMSESLAYHLAHPERLGTDEVLAEAMVLLEEAEAVDPAGPRHRQEVAELRALIEASAALVRVTLVSDSETEVTVYRVGRLGKFDRRRLELRPGTYTVVGKRKGYRDVRLTLVVPRGGSPEPLEVSCKERI